MGWEFATFGIAVVTVVSGFNYWVIRLVVKPTNDRLNEVIGELRELKKSHKSREDLNTIISLAIHKNCQRCKSEQKGG